MALWMVLEGSWNWLEFDSLENLKLHIFII